MGPPCRTGDWRRRSLLLFVLERHPDHIVPQSSTWTGISVDAYKYGTADRSGTVPPATAWSGIEVD